MTAVAAVLTANREEALSIDLHLAERQLVEAERIRHEAVRRMHQAEEELVALRLRERELEATNGMLMRLLARESRGLRPEQIPEYVGTPRRYLVIRSLRNRPSPRMGQQGDSFEVSGALLCLRFADGALEWFTPSELIQL